MGYVNFFKQNSLTSPPLHERSILYIVILHNICQCPLAKLSRLSLSCHLHTLNLSLSTTAARLEIGQGLGKWVVVSSLGRGRVENWYPTWTWFTTWTRLTWVGFSLGSAR